jgi:hypothetical protein
MIVVSAVAIFAALFLLVRVAWPGGRVGKGRLGIERRPVNLGRSVGDVLGETRRRRLGQALALGEGDVRRSSRRSFRTSCARWSCHCGPASV